jgi:hypothetical protein
LFKRRALHHRALAVSLLDAGEGAL